MQIELWSLHQNTDLHLYRLTVDELARWDDRVKDNGGLLARVHHDVVAFAVDLKVKLKLTDQAFNALFLKN